MHVAVRQVLSVAAAPFAAVILEPAISGALLALGINTQEIAPLITSLTAWLLSQYWFVPAAFTVIGAAGGAWLERFSSSRASKQSKYQKIALDLLKSSSGLRHARQNNYRVRPVVVEQNAMNFRGALRSLEKEGFIVPWIEYEVDPIGFIDLSVQYVDKIAPLLHRGHIADAKRLSAEETERSKQYMAARDKL